MAEEKKSTGEAAAPDAAKPAAGGKAAEAGKKDKKEKELSPEDQSLLDGLVLAVERAGDADADVQSMAILHLVAEVRTATSSMTSVPKPLKFLRPHYGTLKELHAKGVAAGAGASANMKQLADLLAVLAITMSKEGSMDCLSYKKQGNMADLRSWGSEFVGSLGGEIGVEFNKRLLDRSKDKDSMEDEACKDDADLMSLVDVIVPFHLQHNAEAEAVDLLMEVQQLPKLIELAKVSEANEGKAYIDDDNYARICLYLLRCAAYMADPEDLRELLRVAYELYVSQRRHAEALRVALQLDDAEKVAALFADEDCEDLLKKQMAFVLARHRSNFEYAADDDINGIIGNNKLNGYYLELARDLDVVDPKSPDDIYKSHLGDTVGSFARRQRENPGVDSARANLASTFVNAFVNAGFGNDLLMTPEGNEWLYKNKEHGMLSAAASLGMIMMWNVEEGLTHIDKFLYSTEEYVKAGACLAIGIVSSSVRHESDPPIALLPEHLEATAHPITRTAAIVALGIAYAGSAREDVCDCLAPLVATDDTDEAKVPTTQTVAEVALAALSLGVVYVGTCDEDVASTLLQRLMEASDAELDFSMMRLMTLGLALLFLGKMDKADAMLEALKTIEHPIGKYAAVVLETCAYAGTGNVLAIQKMLHICAEHHPVAADSATVAPADAAEPAAEKQDSAIHQSVAVLGIALVAAGDDIGSEMALRTFDHLLHYGDVGVRRAVPLALALVRCSNPEYAIVDQLSRLSHDADAQVAQSAILALGVVGAGTNNSRIAGLLRQLAEHARDAAQLFTVRLAQGLLHMGKGLVGLSPFHSDRQLMAAPGMAGVLIFLHCALDAQATILDKYHFLIYHLASAMHPRMLVAVDEDLNLLPTSVRVGKAVETVGQAGKPKTITGFQTHTTPVLLGVEDRAELADPDSVEPLTLTLESVVIMKKIDPDADATM